MRREGSSLALCLTISSENVLEATKMVQPVEKVIDGRGVRRSCAVPE